METETNLREGDEMATIEAELLEDAPALPMEDMPALPLMDEPLAEPEQLTLQDLNIFDPLAAGEKLANESLVLELHFHAPGWDRSINPESIMDKGLTLPAREEPSVQEQVEQAHKTNTKINPRRIRATKEIIDKKELKKLHSFVNKTINKIKSQRCLASNLLAPGMYILPLKLVNEVDETIEELRRGITRHLDELEPRYNEIIAQAEQDLGPQFKRSDYLSFPQVRAAYAITSRYLSLNVPAALANVNKALFDKAVQDTKQERAEMVTVMREGMRGGFLKLVTHFNEVLGKNEEGKPKVLRTSTAEKLRDFVTTFEDRDLTGDFQLAELAKQVRDLIDGVDPQSIRTNEAFRETLANQFSLIVEKTTSLVHTKERKLALDREV